MDAIKINNLEKKYTEGKKALDNISLSVPKGTIFGFLGPNGAGKTTTVKLLNGTINPTNGNVNVLGIDPVMEPEKLHKVSGVLTEHAGMYDHLSGLDNLIFFGQLFNLSGAECKSRGKDLLKRLDLIDAADVKLKNYSTGMRQRLSLARTLIHRPKILFLDEPTSGLDPESTKSVNKLLLDLSKIEGITIFLCTHQLRYAQEICDEYGLMNNGQLLAQGNLNQLRKQTFDSFKLLIKADKMPSSIKSKEIENDFHELSIKDESEIPQIVNQIVEWGGEIFQVTPSQFSLEDIYFALLEKGGEKDV